MVNNFLKYLRVTSILIRNCFSKETAYRWPFFFWVVVNFLWVGFSFASIELLFTQVPNIAGWGVTEGRFLVAVHNYYSTLVWIFIMPNLIVFWRLVNLGTLDFHLIKPISARFLSSATFFEFDMIPRLIPVTFYLTSILKSYKGTIFWDQWVLATLALIFGLVTFYNFGYFIACWCFWFTKIDSLEDLFNTTQSMSKYPPEIFKGSARYVFVYIIPSIFMAAFPTMILLGKGKFNIFLFTFLAAIISSILSQWFWQFSLKRYSSASS